MSSSSHHHTLTRLPPSARRDIPIARPHDPLSPIYRHPLPPTTQFRSPIARTDIRMTLPIKALPHVQRLGVSADPLTAIALRPAPDAKVVGVVADGGAALERVAVDVRVARGQGVGRLVVAAGEAEGVLGTWWGDGGGVVRA